MGDAVVFSVDVPPVPAIGDAADLPIGCVAEIGCEAPGFVTTMEGDAEEVLFGYNAPVASAKLVSPSTDAKPDSKCGGRTVGSIR